jgi:hypothetical protein
MLRTPTTLTVQGGGIGYIPSDRRSSAMSKPPNEMTREELIEALKAKRNVTLAMKIGEKGD